MTAIDVPAGTAGAGRAFLLLIKSFIGTGVLFLGGAFVDGGFAFSVAILGVLAILGTIGMLLLVNVRKIVPGSFEEIGHHLFGPVMFHIVLLSVGLSQIGFCAAYTNFVVNNSVEVVSRFSHGAVHVSPWVFLIIQGCLYIPASMIRRIQSFAIFSMMGMIFVAFGLVVVSYYAVDHLVEVGHVDDSIVQFNPSRFALYIGTACYTFEGISIVLPIANSMKRPERFGMVLIVAMIITTTVYVFIGSTVYLSWGENVKTIVLFNLPENTFVSIIYLLYIVAIVCTWPLMLFPATEIVEREVLKLVAYGYAKATLRREAQYAKDVERDEARGALLRIASAASVSIHTVDTAARFAALPWSARKLYWVQNLIRLCLVIFVLVLAYLTGDILGKLVSVIGGIGCVPLSFVWPAAYHLRAFPEQGVWGRALDWFLIVVGLLAAIYVTAMTFIA
ncbi:hypothetical protein AMAG_09826 [Allomyces macrogynus ATCC 38327]|uniref:Amino acid transporter transmembrane domain-containing protein n=1 Tax=Allomyces macrogynus (strain ATCC 38327) TaxID=578462 RepID=A0A0L0STP3_ALLM3|nr:hypothetical protein AMAG_09826 [Allomyces macrogynus ATCC 38327]|eukprot:KNE65861.1 hypothetical protein AMAG_09826 [Allomyces macrogynus ATCC 38327]